MHSTGTRKTTSTDHATAGVDARLSAVRAAVKAAAAADLAQARRRAAEGRPTRRRIQWERIVTILMLLAVAGAGAWAVYHQANLAEERAAACSAMIVAADAISNDSRADWDELRELAKAYEARNTPGGYERVVAAERPFSERETRLEAAQAKYQTLRTACTS